VVTLVDHLYGLHLSVANAIVTLMSRRWMVLTSSVVC
jgi:hypothetical protein